MSDAFHYLSLSLTNVRAFSDEQTVDFSRDGKPARWCVILGENGVGKTTILQALAVMRPAPSFGPKAGDQPQGKEAKAPMWTEPAFAEYENEIIQKFVRRMPGQVQATFQARLMSADGKTVEVGYKIATAQSKLVSADPVPCKHKLVGDGPFVIAYSALRHAGQRNSSIIDEAHPTSGLFERTELVDPDEVIEKLEYAALRAERDGDPKERKRSDDVKSKMTAVIAALIPDCEPKDIQMGRPDLPGFTGPTGIQVRTPSGMMPLSDLSLGYQDMVAWIVDLAWRMFTRFPNSPNPFAESAIVLVDEIDLHLHPVWQRSLRDQLLEHFPNIQFIVSTHSPVTAQESLFAGDPLSIVRWEENKAVVVPLPATRRAIALDEVATELFELDSSMPSKIERLLLKRRELIRQTDLTEDQRALLVDLNTFVHVVRDGVADEAELSRLMAKIVGPLEA